MAKKLVFDKKHFGRDGLMPLRRGDDWSLDFQVQETLGSYVRDVDLTDHSATGWFPGADGTPVSVVASLTNADCGKGRLELPATGSQLVALAPEGVCLYITLSNTNSGTTETVETDAEVAEVRDRGFQNY